jgi:DNA-binding GntR family transcriptional regulator
MGLRVRADNETFREKATNAIREAIMSLHYRPGEALIERHLCEETGVSRTLVREALRLLEAEGLVRREGGRGLVVTELSAEEVRDIFDLRIILETELLRRFVAGTSAEILGGMAKILDRAETEAERKGDNYTNLLNDFIKRVRAGGGNAVATTVLESMQSRINYIRVILYRTTSLEEHRTTIVLLRKLHDAMVAGDTDAAVETYRRFLQRAQERAVGIINERKPLQGMSRVAKPKDASG